MTSSSPSSESPEIGASAANGESAATHLTSTVGLFRSLVDYCRVAGIDTAPLLATVGLDEAELADADRRIPVEAHHHAMELAADLSGDACFALHFGEKVLPGHYGVVGMIAMSCTKAGELMDLHRRYQGLVADSVDISYSQEPAGVRLHCRPKFAASNIRIVVESGFSAWISFARWLTGMEGHYPLQVCFPYSAPEDLSEYRRLFGENLLFDQPEASALFDAAMLDLPIPQANPILREELEARAAAQLRDAQTSGDGLLNTLAQAIRAHLADAVPSIELLAAEQAMSSRALQRKLQERGTSYTELLDRCRHELALAYMADGSLTLTDVAFLLGFSEQSAFNRAFKRWTGLTPRQHRQQH